MIVVDASLATKWLLDETETTEARRFLTVRSGSINGPDLLMSEVAGAVVRAVNMARLNEDAGRIVIEKWLEFWCSPDFFAHHFSVSLMHLASDISLKLGHPLSDCIYLALAIDLDCDLATCDAKFRDKAFPTFGRVRLLSELIAH